MRTMLRSASVFLVVILAVGAPVHARTKGPVVVGTDPSGDWSLEGSAAAAPLGDALGQDLLSASIEVRESDVIFGIEVSLLPADDNLTGVYTWDFSIGDKSWRITNLSCDPFEWIPAPGTVPNPNAAACQPADTGPLTAFDLMECGVPRTVNVIYNCVFRATVPAQIDAAAGLISVTVPRTLLETAKGSAIRPAGISGADVSVSFVPAGSTVPAPTDGLTITKSVRLY